MYLAQRKIADAQQAVDRTKTFGKASFQDGLSRAITAARVQEAAAPREAIAHLRDVGDRAAGKGYVLLACEARLRLGEAELRAGDRKAGQDHLSSVKRDATRLGFALIARKAHAAAR